MRGAAFGFTKPTPGWAICSEQDLGQCFSTNVSTLHLKDVCVEDLSGLRKACSYRTSLAGSVQMCSVTLPGKSLCRILN